MKILLTDLEQSATTCSIVNDGWFPVADFNLMDGPRGQLRAVLTGSGEALVEGNMAFTIGSSCDRCCRPMELELAADFAYICSVGSEEHEKGHLDSECLKEDYNRLYLKEPVIDLGEMFCEQVYLSLPSRILCEESCRGLCQVCGTDLNNHRCDCDKDRQDSPFAVLRRLKNS